MVTKTGSEGVSVPNPRSSRYLRDREGYFSDEQKERTFKESRKQSQNLRNRLETRPVRARTLSYFDDVMAFGGVRITELAEFRQGGGKVVGTLCVMVPAELVGAAGARAVRMCSGHYECVHPANELLGDAGLCPLVKSTLGAKMVSSNPLMDNLDMVVGPATCDGKMKLAEMLEDWVPVVMLNVPRVKVGDTTSRLWLEEMKYLKHRLEDLTGRPVKRKNLAREIDLWNRVQVIWGQLSSMRSGPRPPISGQDAMLVAQASQLDDPHRWSKKVGELVGELSEMSARGEFAGEADAARVLLAGSPVMFPNFKVPSIVEESGALIVHDELCSGQRLLSDPVMLDGSSMEEMLVALAERYFFPCTCPCFSPNDERILRLKENIKNLHVEGVVFHTLRGCHLNNLEATKIELELRDMGVPFMKVESEYDEGDIEQVRTRVEAFVEMIKARRHFNRNSQR